MKMRIHLIQALGLFLSLTGTPAAAAEIWNCTVHDELVAGAVELSPGHVQIKIDGGHFVWGDLPEDHFRLLVDNDSSAVAVFAQATTTVPGVKVTGGPPAQDAAMQAHLAALAPIPLVDAYAIVLDKVHGIERTGSVGTTKVSDYSHGECQRQGAADPKPN